MLQLDGGRVVSFSFEPIGFRFVSLFPRPWRKRVKSISPSFESKLQRTVSDLNRSQQISQHKSCKTMFTHCSYRVIILLSYCSHHKVQSFRSTNFISTWKRLCIEKLARLETLVFLDLSCRNVLLKRKRSQRRQPIFLHEFVGTCWMCDCMS